MFISFVKMYTGFAGSLVVNRPESGEGRLQYFLLMFEHNAELVRIFSAVPLCSFPNVEMGQTLLSKRLQDCVTVRSLQTGLFGDFLHRCFAQFQKGEVYLSFPLL